MVLDVIKQVGPRGHFLMEDHTCQHMRDVRLSPLLRQKNLDGTLRDPREVALEEFKRIDATHQPEPLPKHVLIELDRKKPPKCGIPGWLARCLTKKNQCTKTDLLRMGYARPCRIGSGRSISGKALGRRFERINPAWKEVKARRIQSQSFMNRGGMRNEKHAAKHFVG